MEAKEEKNNLDETMNLGSEIRLSESITKQMKIGTIKTIREIRKMMNGVKYNFHFCIGREKGWFGDEEFDFPAAEATYRKAFDLVIEGGLSDEEYENVDEKGIKELDGLLTRFL